MIFWINGSQFTKFTDIDLQRWKDYGVDGFVASTQWLPGMGSNQTLVANGNAELKGDEFAFQRALRDTKIVSRAKKLGMKTYLGFYMSNYFNPRTPLSEWFDDAAWNTKVVPTVTTFAATAKLFGFDGLAVDQEMYPQEGGTATATWSTNYPGNTRSAQDTRAMATRRGKQVMEAIVHAFPHVQLEVYNSLFPESWSELLQVEVNDKSGWSDLLHLDFWEGMTSVKGYDAIRFAEATFYKTAGLSGATWDAAIQYNVNRMYALFSRRFSNWSYASSRLFVTPFGWIDAGATDFERAYPPGYVTTQLDAFRTWGTGGEFLNFANQLTTFDYKPYKDAMRAASTPAVVDSEAPSLAVTKVTRNGSKLDIAGTAHDNLGIQAVRWSNVGKSGGDAAAMTWTVLSGDYRSGWNWQMDWSFDGIDVPAGATEIAVTAEDIKGLTTTVTVPVPL